jgi:hypothetical protein
MALLTPEQKAALDVAHAADETVALADATLELAARIKRTIRDMVPAQEALAADGRLEMAAYHWQDTWTQILVTINASVGTVEQQTAAIAAVLATYPGKYTQEGLVASAVALRAAVERLAVSTAETVVTDLADAREAFSLLWE